VRWDLVPRRKQRVAARVIKNRALVVVLDKRELHRLNEVGARVWELCDGRDLGAIRQRLVKEFAVAEDVAAHDLEAFVEQLVSVGALELTEAP